MQGICFKEPLLHATIEGRKTQTRRIMNPQPLEVCQKKDYYDNEYGYELFDGELYKPLKPRYKVGEIFYLKEPYRYTGAPKGHFAEFDYLYDKTEFTRQFAETLPDWKNKLFMPASAARHFIKITDVRVERLQDISDEDCIKEGIIPVYTDDGVVYKWREPIGPRSAWCRKPQEAYHCLIDSINGKGTWDSNPYVWAYDYELHKPE